MYKIHLILKPPGRSDFSPSSRTSSNSHTMLTYHEQNVQAPNTPPSAGAGGGAILAHATAPTIAPPSRHTDSPIVGLTSTQSRPSHEPSEIDVSNPPRWQMVEYRHQGCDKCHAFVAFNSRFTTDMNKHYEKVVELAINTINVFHEVPPRVVGVDVSRRFEKATSRLIVEVTTSSAT